MISRFLSRFLFLVYIWHIVFWKCGGLDVTTIYRLNGDLQSNYTFAECHARTNALGLPFTAPNGSTFEPEVGLVVPSCQIGLKPNCPWTSRGWEIAGGSDLNLPPLKLRHEMVHIHTNGMRMSQLIPLFWNRFNFSIKASTRGTARIFLLTDTDIANTEFYVLDVIHNMLYLAHQTSSMLKCGKGRQYVYDIDLGPGIGIRRCHSIGNIYIRWLGEEYVMFKMDMTGGRMQLWRNGSSTALFVQSDPSPLRVKYIAVTTSEIERDWILYLDGRLWSLIGVSGTLKSPILTLDSNERICISFFAFMESAPGSQSAIKVSARLHNGSQKYMAQIDSRKWENRRKWILHRLVYKLSDHNDNHDIQIVIEGLKANPFAIIAVHGLMGCNPDDEEEIAVTEISFDKSKPFICNVPDIQDVEESIKNCPPCLHGGECESFSGQCVCPPGFTGDICEEGCGENSFGRDCLGQCSGHEDGCTGLVLCVPLIGCNCAPGYSGIGCNIECQPGWYGPNCSYTCGNCSSGTFCDTFTGVCSEGCAPGFYPPLCKKTYSYLLQAPTITEVESTRVTFTFSSGPGAISGAGDPCFYQVQLKDDQTPSHWTSRTPVLLERHVDSEPVIGMVGELRPGIEYRIRIILIDRDGSYYSNESAVPFITVYTNCQVPTSPSYDIKAKWRTRHEFEIEWKYKPNDRTACGLTHYRVYLREGWRHYLYNITKGDKIIVPNRSSNFRYSVQIQAVTSRGPSTASELVTVIPLQGAPSQVTRLVTKQVSPTELGVCWKEPRAKSGKVESYVVEYECLKYLACPDMDCKDSAGRVETTESNVTLSGLHPHAQYSIKVAAFTVEMGPWTKTKSATSFSAPEAAPEAGNRSVISRTATTMEITWEPVADCRLLHGFPLHYHYWLYTEEPDAKISLVAEGNVTNPPVKFTDLRSYTNYMVKVEQVVTGGLHNPNYKLVISARTRGTVASAVKQLKSTDITSSTVSITWKYPVGLPRDAVKYFVISFKCTKLLACDDSLVKCNSSGNIKRNQTYVSLTDLNSYANYEIRVAAFTGETGNHATLSVSTLSGDPEIAPSLDSKNPPRSGSTWISVSWKPPLDCSLQHGPLLGYRHRIFEENNSESLTLSSSSDSVFTEKTLANFTTLPSFTSFRIDIWIVNNKSVGESWKAKKVLSFTVRTRPKVPDPVEELAAYKHGEDVVGLRWRYSSYFHGPIDSAEIQVTGNNKTFLKRVKTLPCPVWPQLVCYDVESLEANSSYVISVRPFSSFIGELGIPTNVSVWTIEEVPDPPSFVRLIQKSNMSFIIEWGHPNMTNGILRSFRIVTDHVDSYASEICCDSSMSADVEVFRENSTYSAQIKGLRPASEYFITIVAVTLAASSPVTMTIYTKPGIPQLRDNPPYLLRETITDTTTDVLLSPASDSNGGPIWTYFVMVCPKSEEIDEDDDEDVDPVLSEVKTEVKRNGFIAITLNDEELDDVLIVTIGNGEESLGLYGFVKNRPLRSNSTYTVIQIAMSEYMGSRSFGIAESEPFTTRH